jgi:hypothetical protein
MFDQQNGLRLVLLVCQTLVVTQVNNVLQHLHLQLLQLVHLLNHNQIHNHIILSNMQRLLLLLLVVQLQLQLQLQQ